MARALVPTRIGTRGLRISHSGRTTKGLLQFACADHVVNVPRAFRSQLWLYVFALRGGQNLAV